MKDDTPDPIPPTVETDQPSGANTEPVTKEDQEQNESSKSPLFLYFLILSLILISFASVFWIWKQMNERLADTENQLFEITQYIKSLDIKPELLALKENLNSETKSLSNRLNEQQKLQESLGQAVVKAHTSATRRQKEWVVAEAFYLVELAKQRLHLMRDINSAIIALQNANNTLQELGDPTFLPLREALDSDISHLQAFRSPDLVSIEHKIDTILINYNPLPIKPDTQGGTPITLLDEKQNSQYEEEQSSNPLVSLVQELNKHLVVRHHHDPLQPQPSLQAQIYQHQILRLRLESARLAVLREDDAEFHNQLHAAIEWLDTHYAYTTNEQIKKELKDLEKINIRPTLPDIDKSIEALKAVRGTLNHIGEDNT